MLEYQGNIRKVIYMYNNIIQYKDKVLNEILDINNFTTSYKIMWFDAIYKEIINGRKSAKIKKLAAKMVATSFYPIIYGGLNFGEQDKLKDIGLYLKNNFDIDISENEDYICGYIMGCNDENLNKMIMNLTKYVPYRLIRPFYKDIIKSKEDEINKKLSGSQINSYIQELSNSNSNIEALYKINKDTKMIEFNEDWINYIIDNKDMIKDLINHTLISYLEKKNPGDFEIEYKLHPIGGNVK